MNGISPNHMADFFGSRWSRASAERVSLVYFNFRSGAAGRGITHVEELLPTWGKRCLLDVFPLANDAPDGLLRLYDIRTIDGRGWPCLSLWGGVIEPNPNMQTNPRSSLDTYFAFLLTDKRSVQANPASTHVILPLYPIWSGFAINTVFYAAILGYSHLLRSLRDE